MLVVVVLLVLAAGGVLVGSVVAGHPEWAWISVVCSGVAAALLAVAQVRRRRRTRGPVADRPVSAEERASASTDGEQQAEAVPSDEAEPSGEGGADVAEADKEPAEEDTDAADLLVVSELDNSVVVLDERPRYHLEVCDWLGGRATIAVPVAEARELGFTPCALCTPDTTLAARQRATR